MQRLSPQRIIAVLVLCVCVFLGWQLTVSPDSGLFSNITYYACPSTLSNCAYNGDGGQAATPSDSNPCLTKALPCATIAGAVGKFRNYTLHSAIVTVQLADTSTGCFQPSATLIDNIVQGWSRGLAYDFSSQSTGGNGQTDAYPTGGVYIHGNDTTPTNVNITGVSGACSGTTANTINGIVAANTILRVAGVTFNRFLGTAITAPHSLLLLENMGGAGDTAATAAYFASVHPGVLRFGGAAITLTNYAFGLDVDGSGSILDDQTPAGCGTYNFTSSIAGVALEIQEGSHAYTNCGTYSYAGTGPYVAWQAQDFGQIFFNDGAQLTVTFNGANILPFNAVVGAFIEAYTCAAAFDFTCTNTSSGSIYAKAQTNSSVLLVGTTGKGSATADNLATKGGVVSINWFNDTDRTWGAASNSILKIQGLQGLSGTTTSSKNLRGTCTFSAATTCVVSFGTAEPDSSYFVTVTAAATGISPWVTGKGTSGFTINSLLTTSTTADWHLIR